MEPDRIYDDVVVGESYVTNIYARRGTFNQEVQHFYPTENNRLTTDLETPYAHCLSNGVCYWTREDALADIRWRPRTDLPCMNCLLFGDVATAKRCDRYTRQESAGGMVRCCGQCEQMWGADACVELIEVRTNHLFESMPMHDTISTSVEEPDPKRMRDIGIWSDEESRLRAEGSVAWRPINLSYGDVDVKAEVVASYQRGTAGQIALLEPETYVGRPPAADCLKIARRLVETWDGIDEEVAAAQETQETDQSDENHLDEAGESADPGPGDENTNSGHADQEQEDVDLGIDDEVRHWCETILGAACDLYQEQVKTFGRADANTINDAWQEVSLEALAQIRRYFMIKQVMRRRGSSESEVCDVALAEVPEEMRGWFEELVPEMLRESPSYEVFDSSDW